MSVSSFVKPHLWLYHENGELEMVKGIAMEEAELTIPFDFMMIFKALGDSTRLELIRCLLQGILTTQELAKKLKISEAAVSKQLKVLGKAGLVKKRQRGHYVEYEFCMEVIDFIPYQFYETMKG